MSMAHLNIPNYTAGSETKTGRYMINFVHLIAITLLVAFISACQPTTDDSSVLASAKEGYKTFQGGDMTAWANTQAEDVVWTIPEGFPYSGTYLGPQAVIDGVFTPIMQLWPGRGRKLSTFRKYRFHQHANTRWWPVK